VVPKSPATAGRGAPRARRGALASPLLQHIKHKFQKSGSVASIISGQDFKCEIVPLRIEKREQLRAKQKNIYVATFAMINLQHHRRATAERPVIDEGLL
jgi:hypothetical protein